MKYDTQRKPKVLTVSGKEDPLEKQEMILAGHSSRPGFFMPLNPTRNFVKQAHFSNPVLGSRGKGKLRKLTKISVDY